MTAAAPHRRIPWTIVVCAAGLLGLGLACIDRGDELSGRGELFGRQVVWIVLSLPALFAVTLVPYRSLRWISFPLFWGSLLLLAAVYVMPPRHGARRWIPLGVMDFQPSEAAKLAFILALSNYLMFRRNYRTLPGLFAPFLLTLVPAGLILREPDLGTALVFFPVLYAMLFAAGARPRHLAFVGVCGLAVLPVFWNAMSSEQKSRVVTLFTQRDSGETPQGDGYHLHQSKQVLALGGVWGSEMTGMPVADPHAYHLPAGRTDFVFCLVGERFGLAGCGLTLLLFAVLFVRGLMIACATREPFGRLLAIGIVTLLATQTIINAGMTVGLMPITGLTLPLMSYGGSSLFATCLALGLLINVAMRPGYEVSGEPFRFREKP